MTYKYMEEQIKGAKDLADKYPNIQTHQDIYKEHVEVLKKAQAYDEIELLYEDKDDMPRYEFVEEVGRILNMEDEK